MSAAQSAVGRMDPSLCVAPVPFELAKINLNTIKLDFITTNTIANKATWVSHNKHPQS
jgi:hypothetical protein